MKRLKSIIKFLRRYLEETAALILLGIIIAFQRMWSTAPPNNTFLYVAAAVFSLTSVFTFIYFIVRIWRKHKSRIAKSIKTLYTKIASRLVLLLEKISKKFGRGTLLSGKTIVSFDFVMHGDSAIARRRKIRWKQLQSDDERLSYLYAGMITGKIRSGKNIYSFETPRELSQKHADNNEEDELFDLYNTHRYNVTSAGRERLEELRRLLGIK